MLSAICVDEKSVRIMAWSSEGARSCNYSGEDTFPAQSVSLVSRTRSEVRHERVVLGVGAAFYHQARLVFAENAVVSSQRSPDAGVTCFV